MDKELQFFEWLKKNDFEKIYEKNIQEAQQEGIQFGILFVAYKLVEAQMPVNFICNITKLSQQVVLDMRVHFNM